MGCGNDFPHAEWITQRTTFSLGLQVKCSELEREHVSRVLTDVYITTTRVCEEQVPMQLDTFDRTKRKAKLKE